MRKGDKRVFTNSSLVKEMLEMRNSGETLVSIAKHFHVDHTSIVYQIKKYTFPKKNNTSQQEFYEEIIQSFVREGHCPQCDMRLESEYHKKFPCEIL